jgi:hypothetical protein
LGLGNGNPVAGSYTGPFRPHSPHTRQKEIAMAKNDQILLDGIIDDRVAKKKPSDRRDEVFEYFALEQLLKFADLTPSEIELGWVDGRDDGGIDGIFIFVNDLLVTDSRTFESIRGRIDLTLWIITCKHHDTFAQVTVDKLVATFSEFLDLSKRSTELQGAYSPVLVQARERLVSVYRALATRISHFAVNVAYVSRGDSNAVGAAVQGRGDQAQSAVQSLFSGCSASFSFVGAAELVAMERQARRFSLTLPFIQSLAHGERYVLLCRLEDYANFIRDDNRQIRRYLFDSNVRDFAGLNRVNEDIASSLQSSESPDFWWLNNGVTILVTKAITVGNEIMLDDVQIVNGLQTTESIARYFNEGGRDSAKRAVLVKIVKTNDPAVRDAIIRATNNQTGVEQQSLHATDKIQRDIEQILLTEDWYYDRRKNFYANQGIPQHKIVTPLYVAAALIGIVKKDPAKASGLRQRFMRKSESYEAVFSEKQDLTVWPRLVSLTKFVDAELITLRATRSAASGERFLKRWRYLVALIFVARLLGRFSYSSKDIAGLDRSLFNSSTFSEIWRVISEVASDPTHEGKRAIRGKLARRICSQVAAHFGIRDERALDASMGSESNGIFTPATTSTWDHVYEDFLNRVDAILPTQPWPTGVHLLVAGQLGCPPRDVTDAIQELIDRKRRKRQEKGVVYNDDDA